MRLPDWAGRHPLAVALVGCLLLGLLLGWLASPLPQPTAASLRQDAWVVPTRAQLQRFDDHDFKRLLGSPAWADAVPAGAPGAGGGDGNPATAVPAWSLVGTVLSPAPVALILDTAHGKVERLAVGATLPDGARLKGIGRDAIDISAAGCDLRVGMFQTQQGLDTHACATPAKAGSAAEAGDH